jgi:hypothetical protein
MPRRQCFLALIASEHCGGRQKCAVERRAIIVRELDQLGFDDEAAEFDQVPRALAPLHNPLSSVMPGKFRFKPS